VKKGRHRSCLPYCRKGRKMGRTLQERPETATAEGIPRSIEVRGTRRRGKMRTTTWAAGGWISESSGASAWIWAVCSRYDWAKIDTAEKKLERTIRTADARNKSLRACRQGRDAGCCAQGRRQPEHVAVKPCSSIEPRRRTANDVALLVSLVPGNRASPAIFEIARRARAEFART